MPRLRWWELPPLIGLVAFGAAFVARTSFVVDGQRYFSLFDDAMISMRYAKNLASGAGLVWNVGGEAVEGYSNPLWTLGMAVAHLAGLPSSKVSLIVEAAGMVLLLANVLVARQLALRLAPGSHAGWLTVWLVAGYYPLLYWTLRGMEVGLAALLVSLLVLFALRARDGDGSRDPWLLAAVASLGVLTRLDLVVPVAVVAAWLIVEGGVHRRRLVTPMLGAVVVVVALHTAFRVVYYGDWLPNTYYLKATGIPLSDRLARGVGGLVTIGQLELFVVLGLAAAGLMAFRSDLHRSVWLLALVFLGQCGYSAFVGGDAWEGVELANRFVATGATSLLVLTAIVIDRASRSGTNARLALTGTAAAIAAVIVPMRVLDFRPASDLQLGKLPAGGWAVRVGVPLLTILMILGARGALRRGSARSAVAVVLLVAALIGTTAREARDWIDHGAFDQSDERTARLGIALRRLTDPGTTIGVAAAGGSTYFSERDTIDLGGKADPDIARLSPRPGVPFIPGHNKYDYRLSLRHEMDVIVALGGTTDADRVLLKSRGFEQFAPLLFVRSDASGVDRAGLRALGRWLGGP